MRPDLAKLTTERERRGGWMESKKYGGKVKVVHDAGHDYDNEYGGFRSSSRRKAYGYNHKEFSDVLSPLKGALRANLGRPWDDVYSEFCQNLDRRSVSGIHIFGHLCGRGGEVTIRGLYVGDDGKVYEYPYGGHYFNKTQPSEVDGFYVHPVTGILRYAPRKYRKHGYHEEAVLRSLKEGKEVEIDGHKYETIDGIWFETWYTLETKLEFHPCSVKEKDDKWYKDRGYERHSKTGIWGHWYEIKNHPTLARKRSLNKKEIKVVKQHILDRIKELEAE